MPRPEIELFKELDPQALQKKFLNSLIKIQNVGRGSIWIQKKEGPFSEICPFPDARRESYYWSE